MIHDRNKYPLPAWHPETELRAADLLGLEPYLLGRAQIADGDAIGIDRIPDWKQSIQFARSSNTRATVTVRDLRGITPGGHVVWLSDTDSLEAEAGDLLPGNLFDAWISVNNDKAGAPKFTLDITPANEHSKADEMTSPDNLYLGQYRVPHVEENDQLRVERRPVCRRLCAFGPVTDPDWAVWSGPVRAKIESLTAGASGQANRNAVSLALNIELLRLTFEWAVLPVPELAQRARLIRWLAALDNGSAPDVTAAIDPFDWTYATGEELPATIAGMFPEMQEKATSGLAESLPVLLNLLATGSVNFHAPIALLRQWNEELEEAKRTGFSENGKRAVAGSIESALNGNEWSKAVALITAMNLGLRTSNPDNLSGASAILDQIFRTVRDAPKGRVAAGPMAFYWLARAASLETGFTQRRSQYMGTYLARLTSRSSQPAGSDRMAQYLERIAKEIPAKEITAFTWWKRTEPRDAGRGLRIAIVGGRSSGKSALARRLIVESGSRSQTTYPESGAVETRGMLSARKRTMDAAILEIDSSTSSFDRLLRGSSTDPVVTAMLESQLVVLCIAPREADEWSSQALKDLVLWLRKRVPETVFAIAYTLADEYGVVDQDGLRIAGTKNQGDQLARMQTANDPKREWDSFVSGKAQTTVNQGRTGDLKWVGSKTTAGESSPTKQHILENTAQLWRALVNNEDSRGDVLLNGYFIAADSRDAVLKSDSTCGVAHLLTDFLACIRGAA